MKIEYTFSDTGTDANNPFLHLEPNVQDWLFCTMQEFINDAVELSARHPDLQELFIADKDFAYGKKGVNSAIGFAAGICNKKYRGKKQDISKTMIPYVEKLFNIIVNFYTMGNQKNWFYTKKPIPYQIQFVEHKYELELDDKLFEIAK